MDLPARRIWFRSRCKYWRSTNEAFDFCAISHEAHETSICGCSLDERNTMRHWHPPRHFAGLHSFARPDAKEALKVRNFRLLFIAQGVSTSGAIMQEIAVAWLVLHLTHSYTALGLVVVFQYMPMLLFGAWGACSAIGSTGGCCSL